MSQSCPPSQDSDASYVPPVSKRCRKRKGTNVPQSFPPGTEGLSIVEARKVRNRMSAKASRDRQKHRVSVLEAEVSVLKQENAALRRRLAELENGAGSGAGCTISGSNTHTHTHNFTAASPAAVTSLALNTSPETVQLPIAPSSVAAPPPGVPTRLFNESAALVYHLPHPAPHELCAVGS